ncbi:MAG: restriction endonuclease subunit S [Candidatus Helarchaeota archaeon]
MSEWKEVTLQDVVTKLGDGLHGTPKYDDDGEYYFINGNNLRNGKIVVDERTRKASVEEYTKYKKDLNDRTILVSINGTLGNVALYNNEKCFLGKSACYFNVRDDVNKLFIKYVVINRHFQRYIDIFAHGTTIKNVSLKTMREYPFALPPLPEQRAIAAVLSSLDDKIDLLQRQNETLEALAQTLFRQWFVEEAEDDWEEKELSFFGQIICGKTPSKKKPEYFDGDIPFIKIPDMHGNVFVFNTGDTLSEAGKNSQINKTLPAKSICVSCIATVGLVSMNILESQTNQQINSIIPKKPEYRHFLFLHMRRSTDLLTAMASGGTATLNLNTGNFSKIIVNFPGEDLLFNFHNLIEPVFNKIFNNQSQIKTLEKLRDTLLPKLMSGEVRVQ